MSKVRKRWLYAGVAVTTVGIAALFIAASVLSRRFEPFVREQAIQYMSERFDSDVKIATLRIKMPKLSPLNVLLKHGKGVTARVEGEGISMRYRNAPDLPQLFAINKFTLDVDLGTLFEDVKTVNSCGWTEWRFSFPPKGERKPLGESGTEPQPEPEPARIQSPDSTVEIRNGKLAILPKDRSRIRSNSIFNG